MNRFKFMRGEAIGAWMSHWRQWLWIVFAVAIIGAMSVALVYERSSASVPAEPHPPESSVSYHDEPVLVPPPPEIDPDVVESLLSRDSIKAIDDPHFLPGIEAAHFMFPDEQVIGLEINGDIRAYPIPVLSAHEIVNDVVGGEDIAVTWCPLCYTALVFSRRAGTGGDTLSFGVSGKLLYETLVMYDRESDSLWSQLYGAALDGPMVGTRLSFFPSVFTTWSAWIEENLETLVLDKDETCRRYSCGNYSSNPRGGYDVDPYASYYNQPDEGVINRQIPRDSEQAVGTAKVRVLGIRVAGAAKAYPYAAFESRSWFNDELGGIPILVWLDIDTQSGLAYLRNLDGLELTFEASSGSDKILVDRETGSQWETASGEAISGPLLGSHLTPVIATSAFEFGWYDYFPESETFNDQ